MNAYTFSFEFFRISFHTNLYYSFKTIGTFIARSIADKVISKEFTTNSYVKHESNGLVCEIICHAKVLTNMNDHLFHLSHIWCHNNGGFTAVKDLTDKVFSILFRFFLF